MVDYLPAIKENKGIFGFGLSHNDNLDLLTLVIFAYSGLLIQFFFSSGTDVNGINGPATLALWGYGITGVALFLMIFMSFYINNSQEKLRFENQDISIMEVIKSLVLTSSLPIVLSLGTIIFLMFVNYQFLERINKGNVPDTYITYKSFSSVLLICQIGIIVKYLYNELEELVTHKINSKENAIIKSLSYILITLNFIFILIMYILLEFFSTDG